MRPGQLICFVLVAAAGLGLSSCALFKGGKKPVRLELRYDETAYINYGYAFELDAWVIYNNGKEKKVTGKPELDVEISGAWYRDNGSVIVDGYPRQLSANVIRVNAVYTKDETSLSASADIPFNYKGDIVLGFTGASGAKGSKGEKGTTPLLFRDGKEGGTGGNGHDGGNGDNLTVHVWQDSTDYVFVRVNNLTTSQKYIYKVRNTGYAVRINVSGGNGGQGGDGGDGGDGKDGSAAGTKTKLPGDGGKGGTGGNGGNGGNGGSVYVFIHPNASFFLSQVTCTSSGGSSGASGEGGKGGKPGTPLTGQAAASEGAKGASGATGFFGSQGTFQVLLEEFDIEY